MASKRNSVFYKQADQAEELHSGYLHKSPQLGHLKTYGSWKRRFFILFRLNEDSYQLKYFKNRETQDKSMGGIDLSQVSLMFLCTESHPLWSWIHKNFRCPASCVLVLKVPKRDYYLIGENSEEVDEWFTVLFKAQMNRPQKLLSPEEYRKIRSISEPLTAVLITPCVTDQQDHEYKQLARLSAPELSSRDAEDSIYDYPKNYRKILEIEDDVNNGNNEDGDEDGDDDDDEDEKNEYETSGSHYMEMSKVQEVIKESQQRRDVPLSCPAQENGVNGDAENSLMESVTEVFDSLRIQLRESTVPHSPKPETHRQSVKAEDAEAVPSDLTTCTDSSEQQANHQKNGLGTGCVGFWRTHLNGKASPMVQSETCSSESESLILKEQEVFVCQEDLATHLILAENAGRPCVSDWTRQGQTTCLFHKGDLILAINDLHTESVEEVHMYLRKLLKNQVKLTIQRLPGSLPLHSDPC